MRNFGLIGYPLGHSFSKKYFTDKFENESVDAVYELYEIADIEQFEKLIQSVALSGLNVTIPYKQRVIPFLDELDETAANIGAVNVIRFIRSADKLVLKGYNSDVIGFVESIKPRLKPHHQKALMLGTGGAAKAMTYGLQKLGLEVTYVSRSVDNAMENTAQHPLISYTDINEAVMRDHSVIVNASPVGTFPHVDASPDIPYHLLTEKHLLFDAVYNPAETLFMKNGKQYGADTLNGEQMLIGQAEEAWRIWNEDSV